MVARLTCDWWVLIVFWMSDIGWEARSLQGKQCSVQSDTSSDCVKSSKTHPWGLGRRFTHLIHEARPQAGQRFALFKNAPDVFEQCGGRLTPSMLVSAFSSTSGTDCQKDKTRKGHLTPAGLFQRLCPTQASFQAAIKKPEGRKGSPEE